MPADMLPVSLSTGVGVGVLAGVVSGVCFLVFNGLAWSKRVKKGEKLRAEDQVVCSSCTSPTSEVCSSCSLPLCYSCSVGGNETIRCRACCNDRLFLSQELNSGNSFLRYLKETVSFGSWFESNSNLNSSKGTSAIGANNATIPKITRRSEDEVKEVRDFLQRLAEYMTGGSLDDVSVNKMYHHPEYLPVTAGQPINSSHAKLKQLVQRVIEEALKLPAFLDYSGVDRGPDGRLPEFSPQTYEDLLATAILNKVIDKYQSDIKRSNGASSSGVHSGSSSPENSGRGKRRKHIKRDSSPESPDQSSLEPMSHDDYAQTDSSGHVSDTPRIDKYDSSDEDEIRKKSYSNPVDGALATINFKNQTRVQFPEFGGDIIEPACDSLNLFNDEDANGSAVGNGDLYASNNSWEENWLFKKQKIKPSQSSSVPMVIPTSNVDCKVKIGDQDVEDTTDLSDIESEPESHSDIKQVLVQSKTIIGGKNPDITMALNVEDEINNNEEKFNFDIDFEEAQSLQSPKEKNKMALNRFMSSNLDSDDTDRESNLNSFVTTSTTLEMNGGLNHITEATNLDVVDSREIEEPAVNHQQEGEYTETFAIPVQRHLDSLKRQHTPKEELDFDEDEELDDMDEAPPLPPTPVPIMSDLDETIEKIIIPENAAVVDVDVGNVVVDVVDTSAPDAFEVHYACDMLDKSDENVELRHQVGDVPVEDIPGSIAEREHKKWLNPVPMPHNPYSKEAIESRLNKQNRSSVFDLITMSPTEMKHAKEKRLEGREEEDTYERYGRDYYINEAKRSAGSRSSMSKSPVSEIFPLVKPKVSLANSLNDLEALSLHQNLNRVCMRSRNASRAFATNPLFESGLNDEVEPSKPQRIKREQVQKIPDDSLRLNIPDRAEVTETGYESLSGLRRSSSSSFGSFYQYKKRPSLNGLFGGSLRIKNYEYNGI